MASPPVGLAATTNLVGEGRFLIPNKATLLAISSDHNEPAIICANLASVVQSHCGLTARLANPRLRRWQPRVSTHALTPSMRMRARAVRLHMCARPNIRELGRTSVRLAESVCARIYSD